MRTDPHAHTQTQTHAHVRTLSHAIILTQTRARRPAQSRNSVTALGATAIQRAPRRGQPQFHAAAHSTQIISCVIFPQE